MNATITGTMAGSDHLPHNGSVRYVVLLRGINVGGKNIIKMADLRCAFTTLGCMDVSTYIQSGNVLFDSKVKNTQTLCFAIEQALAKEFMGTFHVIVLTREQLETVVRNAPPGFGEDPARYRYDVAFVRPPARADLILPTISLKEGVDEAFQHNGVLYLKRLTTRASQSHLPRLTLNAAYSSLTIRNWNTTSQLCRLIGAGGAPIR
jgi:uncharacterized protein (DUF1697 family)